MGDHEYFFNTLQLKHITSILSKVADKVVQDLVGQKDVAKP